MSPNDWQSERLLVVDTIQERAGLSATAIDELLDGHDVTQFFDLVRDILDAGARWLDDERDVGVASSTSSQRQ
jgi:hypothetical protein